jgi:hypothetical protein
METARSAYHCPPWCVMSLAEHEQLADADPWHLGRAVTFGEHEITLLALVDRGGLVDAGILDAQGNFMTTTVLRRYVATLQAMVAMIDALPPGSGKSG